MKQWNECALYTTLPQSEPSTSSYGENDRNSIKFSKKLIKGPKACSQKQGAGQAGA